MRLRGWELSSQLPLGLEPVSSCVAVAAAAAAVAADDDEMIAWNWKVVEQ